MKIYVAHSNNFDYERKLYTPIRQSVLNSDYEFFLPHENGQHADSKDVMHACGLVLAEVTEQSTGEGIELGRAEALGIPIVCIQEQGSKRSKSLSYITRDFIEYKDATDMIEKIQTFLTKSNP